LSGDHCATAKATATRGRLQYLFPKIFAQDDIDQYVN